MRPLELSTSGRRRFWQVQALFETVIGLTPSNSFVIAIKNRNQARFEQRL